MGKLIDKQVTTLYVLKGEDGTYILDKEQKKIIDTFKGGSTTETCPACDGDGVVGGDYCDVCNGRRTFTYTRSLDVRPLNAKEWRKRQLTILNGAELTKFLKDNPDSSQILFTGKATEWNNIPVDVKAISVCSRGEVKLYNSASGVYKRYDDEHTDDKRHKGGQHWYYGASKPGLDITSKYKHLDITVAGTNDKLFIRPGSPRVIFDFNKPFDWRYFPPAVKYLFVTFGGMNVSENTINIVAGSKDMYLRGDNVIDGYGGRSHIDKSFDINLCQYWVDDKTNAYPCYIKDCDTKYNEMNFELRNIPYKTMVYQLPSDRNMRVAPSKLRQAEIDKCYHINKRVRPLDARYTVAQYPFKYSDERRVVERWMLEHVTSSEGYTYSIDNNNEINVNGNIRFSGRGRPLTKTYRFNKVTGSFSVYGDDSVSGKNLIPSLANVLPRQCGTLMLSHFKKLENISIVDTEVLSGTLKLRFMDSLKGFGKQHPSIKNLLYYSIDIENINFDSDSVGLSIERDKV